MKRLAFLITIAAASLLPLAAKADVVLLVDLSVPNMVTITATSGTSAATISGTTFTGFYLQNFFNTTTAGTVTSTGVGNISSFLNPPDNSPNGFRANSSTDPGFNIWSYSTDSTGNFTLGTQAFSGSATFTLSATAYAQAVVALGAAVDRNVYFPADDVTDLGTATLIGTWQVVPEPSTFALLGVMAAGALGVREWRKRKAA